jgi:hypothetical protein
VTKLLPPTENDSSALAREEQQLCPRLSIPRTGII